MVDRPPTISRTDPSMPGSIGNQDDALGGAAAPIGWIKPGDPRIEAEREPLLSALYRYGPQHFGANLAVSCA
jgi:hypothetical protein